MLNTAKSKKEIIDLYVVEDSNLIRTTILVALAKHQDFRVVGFAEDGETAVKQISELKPHVAVVDIGLPALDGIQVTKQSKAQVPTLKVIILTGSDTDSDIISALRAGADGYVLKEAFNERLGMAIRAVRAGAVWLDPAIASRLLSLAKDVPALQSNQASKESAKTLSTDEMHLLETVADSECDSDVCFVDPSFMNKLRSNLS